MNSITVAGRIGKDAELRHTSGGEAVASFPVADDQGKDRPTIWWRCQLWGKRAEALVTYLTKGQSVTVSGRVQESEYTSRDGETRKSQDIRVNDIALQGGKQDGHAPAPAHAPAARTAPAPQPTQPGGSSGFDDFDDPIPF